MIFSNREKALLIIVANNMIISINLWLNVVEKDETKDQNDVDLMKKIKDQYEGMKEELVKETPDYTYINIVQGVIRQLTQQIH